MLDHQFPQSLNGLEQLRSRLLGQNITENGAKRTDIAPQGIIFCGFVGSGGQFEQTSSLIVGLPERFVHARRHLIS
jgi:hypothetical protein